MNKEELIAQYFENSISPKGQNQFDQFMVTDPDFAKEVNFRKNLQLVIKKEQQDQVKETLRYFELETQRSTKSYKYFWIAASVVTLLAISSIFYLDKSSPSNEELFAKNFEPYKNVVYPIVRGNNSYDLKAEAFLAYEAEEYEEALKSLNTLLLKTDDAVLLFYKSNILLQLKRTDEAIAILEKNTDIPEILRAQQKWYLALAYLKNNSNDKAIVLFRELINNHNYKKEEAKTLLREFNSE